MPIIDLARRPAPSVEVGLSVQKAVAAFRHARAGALLVMDGAKLVGILSERDLVHRVVGEGRDPRTTRVEEVMTPHVDTVTPDASPEEAFALMTQRRIRHLAVVTARGRAVGMLSLRDVAQARLASAAEQLSTLEQFVTADGPGG
jgi:CBS domain-containing protein